MSDDKRLNAMLGRAGAVFITAVLLVMASNITPAMAADPNSDIPAFITEALPDAQIVGQGTMSWVFWDVYDARLIAPEGRYAPDRPFALRLTYKRHIDGRIIADSSAGEIARQGFNDQTRLASWHESMNRLFTDVEAGSTFTGIYQPDRPTCFFKNDRPVGCVDDPLFGPVFFNIWLAPDTREPDLRQALLGQK